LQLTASSLAALSIISTPKVIDVIIISWLLLTCNADVDACSSGSGSRDNAVDNVIIIDPGNDNDDYPNSNQQ
jgi:hypothetical protein